MKYEDLELDKLYSNNNSHKDFFWMGYLKSGTVIELVCKDTTKLKRNGNIMLVTDRGSYVEVKTGITNSRSYGNNMSYKIIRKNYN